MRVLKLVVRGVLIVAVALTALVVSVIAGWTVWQNRLADASEIYPDHHADAPGRFAASADGLDMHYLTVGDISNDSTGAPVLFIHGYNQNANPEFMRIAERISPTRTAILPDMMGFGFSGRPTDPKYYSLRGQANNIVAMMDSLGLPQVDVVGGSWGGAVAAQLALDHPDRVRRLVLFNAQIAGTGYDVISRSGSLPLGLGRAISWFAIGGGQGGQGFFVSGCPDIDYCPTQAEIDRRMRHALIKGTTDAMYASSLAPTAPPEKRVPADMDKLTVPTAVLHSINDDFIKIEEVEKTVARMPAGTRFTPMDFVSHVPHLKQPDDVAPLMLEALSLPE